MAHFRANALFFLLILVSDQITKVLAYSRLSLGEPVIIIPKSTPLELGFNLTLVYNKGAAFGMFGSLPDFWRRVVLVVVSALALIVVLRFMFREAKDDAIAQFALTGILAGAVGNIIDRIRFDSVVDFLDFYLGSYHWPAFNIADSAISIGVAILVVRIVFGPQAETAPSRSEYR